MGDFQWDPETYPELVKREVPDYERVQQEVADAAAPPPAATRILELGTGTGETAERVLALHPEATLVALDNSAPMLAAARDRLGDRMEPCERALEDELPAGPFELVISALAIHHVEGEGKARLFERVAGVLAPRGRFVLADGVVPDDPRDVITPIDPAFDFLSSLDDQLAWLEAAGFVATVTWAHRDLAVVLATLR